MGQAAGEMRNGLTLLSIDYRVKTAQYFHEA